MKTACYIILGSDYNVNQEVEMQFVKELLDQNYKVNVYSIDLIPVPLESSLATHENLQVRRISADVSVEENMDALGQLIISDSKEGVDELIVMDSIHFLRKEFYGEKVKEIITQQLESEFSSKQLNSPPVIHFITPNYEDPVFNSRLIGDLNLKKFSLVAGDTYESLSTLIKPGMLERLTRIDTTLRNQAEPYSILNKFMASQGFKDIFNDSDEAERIIRNGLSKYLCNQIDLSKISPEEPHIELNDNKIG